MSVPSLRARMAETGLVHIVAAHSPFLAILAEEAGFDGLWASGFELSAPYELQDMSLISITQHLDMLGRSPDARGCRSSRTLMLAMAMRSVSFTLSRNMSGPAPTPL